MFSNKSEESEWTRFSRALGGSPAPKQQETPQDAPAEEPVTLMQAPPAPEPEVYIAPATPPPAPVPAPPPVAAEPAVSTYMPPAPVSAALTRMPDLERGETVIGDGASIEGAVRSERSIRIKGSVQGEVESKQRVVVEEAAQVQARVTAEHVTVLGEVNGAIECAGRLEIASSGRVTGEVSAGTLVIQEGAFFEGSLKMTGQRGS